MLGGFKVLFDAVDVLGECGRGASLNFMAGFPLEIPDLVRQSIKAVRNPQLSPGQVKGLMRTFPLYVHLPDEDQALNEILTGPPPNAPLPLPPRPAAVPAC